MTLIEMAKQIEKYESERLCLVENSSYMVAAIATKYGNDTTRIVSRLNYLPEKQSTDTKRHKLWAEVETALNEYQGKPTDMVMPGMKSPGKMPGL